MKLRSRITGGVSMALVSLTLAAGSAGAGGGPGPGPGTDASLRAARLATARYHLPALAVADGFAGDGECVADPSGGMGEHWINEGRFDAVVDATRPEVLLYEPGRVVDRLVGAEYVAVAPVGQPPELFGQTFEQGPEIGGGMAVHALHVWLWRPNPLGTFAPYNPNVRCPEPGGSRVG